MNTAVALVVVDANGKPIPGTIGYLRASQVQGGFLFCITNNDGYAVWPTVPVPLSGTLQLAGAAAPYGLDGNGIDVTIPPNTNVTIRVGPTSPNPQDLICPPAAPTFKKPPVNLRDWRGAFVIPSALPGIPYGDNQRIWTPAFTCYDDVWQGRILDAFLSRGYTHFPYNCAGSIYHNDYPDMSDDPARVRHDLIKIRRAGAIPVVCACDDQDGGNTEPWRSFSENADLINIAFPMWEMNGPLGVAVSRPDGTFYGRIVDCIANVRRVAPAAELYLHFTAGHGSIGEPERQGWRYCRDAFNVLGLLSQDDGYNRNPTTGDPEGTAAGLQDTAERLVTLGLLNVAFEQSTTPVYHHYPGWDEDRQRRYGRKIWSLAPAIAGYCDGSY